MNKKEDIVEDLFYNTKYNNINALIDKVNSLLPTKVSPKDHDELQLASEDFVNVIKSVSRSNVTVFFGKTLKNIKFVITDENYRRHAICVEFKHLNTITVTSTTLPLCSHQERTYSSLEEVVDTFSSHVECLSSYFYELELIDQSCCVVEPLQPTFKDDYRNILIDKRLWLHIEVTSDGSATNIHLIGHGDKGREKLQVGLLSWDHDKTIVQNIMDVFDLTEFPQGFNEESEEVPMLQEEILCTICFCTELPGSKTLPQPLCPNHRCGSYFHNSCLYQWLVACAGGRLPPLGVVGGACPACQHQLECSDR